MREIKMTVYQYDELSDKAKAKAREWYKEIGVEYEWWDDVFNAAKTIGAMMGIENMDIQFSGFGSQGDGACFTGNYAYKAGSIKAIKAHGAKDKELYRIASILQDAQKRYGRKLTAVLKKISHHYSHRYTVAAVVEHNGEQAPFGVEDTLGNALGDFMSWIYKQLEQEYDYLTSDENIIEMIEANGYEFTEDGKRFARKGV